MSKRLKMFVPLAFCIFSFGCETVVQRENVEVIGKNVVTDVAQVTQVSQGKKGAPIIIIEESHASRGQRLEAAIVLNRLRNDYKVAHIGLEGSIKEKPPIDSKWFFKAARDQPGSGTSVAVSLLHEGEINSVEFMELAYDNIDAIPIETEKEYEVKAPDEAEVYFILATRLYQQALKSLRPDHKTKLEKMLSEAKDKNTTEQEKVNQKVIKYLYSFKPTELSDDPWIKEVSDKLFNKGSSSRLSIEEEIKFLGDVQAHIETTLGALKAEEKQHISVFVDFLKARAASNKTMVDATSVVADKSDTYAVAMVVGAGHTKGIGALLKEADRPFAVITPNFLNSTEDPTALSPQMYDSKVQGKSVYTGQVTETILNAFQSDSNRIPPPVLQQRWFNAKSELYIYTERITQKYFPPGGGKPPGGGELPLFSSGDFDGDFIRIDPSKIKVVKDEETSNALTVVFPVEINPKDPARTKVLWVKSGRSGEGLPPAGEKENVERMLKDALADAKNEKPVKNNPKDAPIKDRPLPKLEGESGRIKITRETTAAFADSEQAVMKRSVISRS